jgi:hypothetical protein
VGSQSFQVSLDPAKIGFTLPSQPLQNSADFFEQGLSFLNASGKTLGSAGILISSLSDELQAHPTLDQRILSNCKNENSSQVTWKGQSSESLLLSLGSSGEFSARISDFGYWSSSRSLFEKFSSASTLDEADYSGDDLDLGVVPLTLERNQNLAAIISAPGHHERSLAIHFVIRETKNIHLKYFGLCGG